MYECESWPIKTTERWRIDAFKLWCWRRLLRVPWTARRSNQSILKEISPESSLEGLMLNLKLQYSGHLMGRTDPFEKTLMPGKTEGGRRVDNRGWNDWMTSLTGWTWVFSKLWELVMAREAWQTVVLGVTESLTWLSDWTELPLLLSYSLALWKASCQVWGVLFRKVNFAKDWRSYSTVNEQLRISSTDTEKLNLANNHMCELVRGLSLSQASDEASQMA